MRKTFASRFAFAVIGACVIAIVPSLAAAGCGGGHATSSSGLTRSSDAGPEPGPDVEVATREGSALLASLSVSPLALVPAFSPDVHDYFVRCAAGSNTLTVAASAAAGGTVAVNQPEVQSAADSLTDTVTLAEGAALVLGTSSGGATGEYWIRCLPADFPTIAVTRHPEAGTPAPGYYLIGNISSGNVSNGVGFYAMALDGNGVPVWYRRSPSPSLGIVNVDWLSPGVISFTPFLAYTFSPAAGGAYQMDRLTPWQVTTASTSGAPLDHHELRALPNGDFMMLSDVIRTGVDLTGFPSFGPDSPMIDCVAQEVDPAGNLVWQWDAADHFDPVADCTFPSSSTTDDGVTVADPFHCNSIDVAANGDLLVSSRHMDSVFYVARSTGAVVWKMGGATFSKDGATYVQIEDDPETAFYRQHDARFQPDGTISLFDDHSAVSGPARAVIYDVDPSAGAAHLTWQCAGSANSLAMGSFRRASDGTGVIDWGFSNANPTMSEVDASCRDLLDIALDAPFASYRAVKVPIGAVDVETLRTTAGTN